MSQRPPMTPGPLWRRPLLGAAVGFGLGMADYALLRALGVEMLIESQDWTLAVVTFFALSFAGLGAVIGRLLDQRQAMRAQAMLIRDQYRELDAAQQELTQARTLAALGRLASGVAHEVRNPLGVIRASASMIAEDLPAEGEPAEAARFIREEVDRLDGFVRRLLALARPIQAEPAWIEAGPLLERAARLVEVDPAGVDLEVDASPGLQVWGDEELLGRLVLGLLRNATEAAEGRVLARARSDPEGGARIEVLDDGPGVEPGRDAEIFEPFYTTRASGTGLGLAMAQKIARAHRAALELERGRGLGPGGRGACFALGLPAPGDDDEEEDR